MNQYPLWKNLLILCALLIGLLYTAPNFFGVSHAVQVQPKSDALRVDAALQQRVEGLLKAGNFTPEKVSLDATHVNIYFSDNDSQNKAKELLEQKLGDDYVLLLNLLPRAPDWMIALYARPMYFGLDLRGGMHLLLQVDMKDALDKALDTAVSDIRNTLIEHDLLYAGLSREGATVTVKFRDADARSKAGAEIKNRLPGLFLSDKDEGGEFLLLATLKQEEQKRIEQAAIQQNLLTLRNRLNGMGLGEPVIQQQGEDRIVVQLPGVQDPKRVHEMIGKTATLQLRMVDMSALDQSGYYSGGTTPPIGDDLFRDRDGGLLPVKKAVIFTGDHITDAKQGFDEHGAPAVLLNLDSMAAHRFKQVTHDNIGKRMAIIMFEKEKGVMKGTVVTAPVIQGEIPNGNVQITGHMTSEEANDVALLLRSGALAAPMEIAEERTVGPSLGEKNIKDGFHSTWVGFAAVTLFMIAYYMVFGTVSILSLGANLLLLVGLLSMSHATLTLPGMAGIALTLGMAIDANVLINERIREELRNGVTPQMAIHAGYDRAFATILDSNVTTFIAGVALLAFGTGPVKGFAVVLCMGIMTSMFSGVLVSRALVNLIYGRRPRLSKVAIG
jgi:preprotein translocase subunit SecD